MVGSAYPAFYFRRKRQALLGRYYLPVFASWPRATPGIYSYSFPTSIE
jgi:hypothetical protein